MFLQIIAFFHKIHWQQTHAILRQETKAKTMHPQIHINAVLFMQQETQHKLAFGDGICCSQPSLVYIIIMIIAWIWQHIFFRIIEHAFHLRRSVNLSKLTRFIAIHIGTFLTVLFASIDNQTHAQRTLIVNHFLYLQLQATSKLARIRIHIRHVIRERVCSAIFLQQLIDVDGTQNILLLIIIIVILAVIIAIFIIVVVIVFFVAGHHQVRIALVSIVRNDPDIDLEWQCLFVLHQLMYALTHTADGVYKIRHRIVKFLNHIQQWSLRDACIETRQCVTNKCLLFFAEF
mmetsp:Transcript_4200/g.7107  ORF Transcript_4200/g.7107 Transcript_4200/m.7107 type:complete len:289 (+) Transcript_4200:181-1047(+)